MKLRFFKKKLPIYNINKDNKVEKVKPQVEKVEVKKENNGEVPPKNKKNKKQEVMNTDFNNKIATAEATIEAMQPEVKVVKKDKGLIERTESSKIILTEDNRQVLVD